MNILARVSLFFHRRFRHLRISAPEIDVCRISFLLVKVAEQLPPGVEADVTLITPVSLLVWLRARQPCLLQTVEFGVLALANAQLAARGPSARLRSLSMVAGSNWQATVVPVASSEPTPTVTSGWRQTLYFVIPGQQGAVNHEWKHPNPPASPTMDDATAPAHELEQRLRELPLAGPGCSRRPWHIGESHIVAGRRVDLFGVSEHSPANNPRTTSLTATLGILLMAAVTSSCSVHHSVSTRPDMASHQPFVTVIHAMPNPTPYRPPSWARGSVITQLPLKPGNRSIALTFDDGPWPKTTGQVLSILRQFKIHATFFLLGPQVRTRPQLVQQELHEGHAVGNHSWTHPKATRRPKLELDATTEAIRQATGLRTMLYRPPYGILNNSLTQLALRRGMAVILWSVDVNDWKRPPVEYITKQVVLSSTPGGIILLHDGGGDRSHTVAALPGIIQNLQAQGYHFVTIPELLQESSLNTSNRSNRKSVHSSHQVRNGDARAGDREASSFQVAHAPRGMVVSADTRIWVLNGSGKQGLAGAVAVRLSRHFGVAASRGNAPESVIHTTVQFSSPDLEALADDIADYVGVGRAQSNSLNIPGPAIVVTLGTGFDDSTL